MKESQAAEWWEGRASALVKQLKMTARALEEYGRHKTGCDIWAGSYRVIDKKKKCSCGLLAAIKSAKARR